MGMSEKGERANIGRQDIPGIFFVTDENLNDRKASWGGKGRVRKKKKRLDGREGGTIVCKN